MSIITRTRQGLTRERILTNAEILALPTIPIEIVPAQGDGFIIIATLAYLRFIWTADYTNIRNDAILILADSNLLTFLNGLRNYNVGAGPHTNLDNLLAAGQDADSVLGHVAVTFPVADGFPVNIESGEASGGNGTLIDNLPLNLLILNGISGNLTGGDPANRLKVTVFYNVVHV